MSNKRPLAPRFINKLDNYLLLNKPEIWSTRIHLVLYYSILFIAVLTALAYLFPDDPRNASMMDYWVGFVMIISAITFIIWLIYLLRFNVFKRYGKLTRASTLLSFLCYFVSTAAIVSFFYVYPLVESNRANMAYTDKEIINDINNINLDICRLEYDSIDHYWRVDSVVVVNNTDRLPPYLKYEHEDDARKLVLTDTTQKVAGFSDHHSMSAIDTSELRLRLRYDSCQKINDSIYIFYEAPNYTFIQPSYGTILANMQRLSNREIYERVIRNYTPPDREKVRKELLPLISKYTAGAKYHHDYASDDSDYEEVKDISKSIDKRYDLVTTDVNLTHIIDRKYNDYVKNMGELLHILYYLTLGITLLLFIFRHSTPRTFFLTFLAAFIVTTLTVLIIAMSNFDESTCFVVALAYFALFILIASTVWKSKTQSVITGISINLFAFLIPVIPFIITGHYFYLKRKVFNDLDIPQVNVDETIQFMDVLLYVEVSGLAILLVLIATYVHALYRKWYSLPVE